MGVLSRAILEIESLQSRTSALVGLGAFYVVFGFYIRG